MGNGQGGQLAGGTEGCENDDGSESLAQEGLLLGLVRPENGTFSTYTVKVPKGISPIKGFVTRPTSPTFW
jgi:hypothetical protein